MAFTDLKFIDQTDALTLRSRLSLHCAHLRGAVHVAEGALVVPPVLSITGDVLADISTLEGHASELEARLGDTAPVFNPPSAPAPAALAAPVKAIASAPSKPLTLDEQAAAILKDNGCKSPAELIVKNERDRMAAMRATLAKSTK